MSFDSSLNHSSLTVSGTLAAIPPVSIHRTKPTKRSPTLAKPTTKNKPPKATVAQCHALTPPSPTFTSDNCHTDKNPPTEQSIHSEPTEDPHEPLGASPCSGTHLPAAGQRLGPLTFADPSKQAAYDFLSTDSIPNSYHGHGKYKDHKALKQNITHRFKLYQGRLFMLRRDDTNKNVGSNTRFDRRLEGNE
jgi:hypothetical protein